MAELFTYRPKIGIGKDLPEDELKEFNSITCVSLNLINLLVYLIHINYYLKYNINVVLNLYCNVIIDFQIENFNILNSKPSFIF